MQRVLSGVRGADCATEELVTNRGLFRLLLSCATAGLQGPHYLEEWQQGRELSDLYVMSGRPPQPSVLLEDVGKTFTPTGKAAPAPT